MSTDRKFCTICGAQRDLAFRFCTSCGAPCESGSRPPGTPAAGSSPSPPAAKLQNLKFPGTLPALLSLICTRMLHNIRNTIREMIKVMIIAFALVLALNTLLQVTNLSQSEFAKSLIAGGGNSSPDTLLFWLLFSAILAFFWAQIRSRGARNTFNKCLSTPRWILLSVKTARSSAFPLMMIGVAIALIIRFFLLTTPTAVTFLVVMFGILYSQQESLWVLIMSLGYSDIIRFFRKGRSVIPAPGYPVMGVCGAFCGFLFVLFYPDNLLIIILIVVLLLAGSVVLLYRKKKPTTPVAPAGTTMLGRKVS